MVVRRRKKVVKQRASRTYGWGLCHRGKGQKGGAGRAGGGKKAHSKKPMFWKTPLGKSGFKYPMHKKVRTISIKKISDLLNSWTKKGLAVKKDDTYEISLKKTGFDKLLGSGRITDKLNITVKKFSRAAKEKIEKAGGTVKGYENA